MSRMELPSREVREINCFCLTGTPSRTGKEKRKVPAIKLTTLKFDCFKEPCETLEKSESRRQYKVLTYKDGLGKDRLGTDYFDILTGQLLMHTPTIERVVCNDVIAFDTKEVAISEQGGKSGLPRVIGIFDCWGRIYKRKNGPRSHLYEFAQCVKIGEHLDKIASLQATCHFEKGGKGRKHMSSEEVRLQRVKPMLRADKYTKEDFTDGTVEATSINRSQEMFVAQRQGKICLPGVEMADDPKYEPRQIVLPARKQGAGFGIYYQNESTKRTPGPRRDVLFPGGSPTRAPPHLKNMHDLITRSLA